MDLCAAPGGWLQVAQKYMPMSSLIVGVDLAPIKPIRGCTTFVDDITTQSCRAQLRRVTPEGTKYDIVMNDGAPNVGGNFAAESYTQAALTLDSLRLASEFLREGGWFVTKVFRSTEYHALLYSMQQLFKKVESTKPVARGTSAEIYVGVRRIPGARQDRPEVARPQSSLRRLRRTQAGDRRARAHETEAQPQRLRRRRGGAL